MNYSNFTTEEFAEERWQVFPHNDLYEVSDLGQVRSATTKKLLKPQQNPKDKYLYVTLYRHTVRKSTPIHRMVAFTFLGEPLPFQTDVNHIDNCRTNSHLSNLHWCTRKQNLHWGKQQGRDNRGERNGGAKLNLDQVREIRELLATKLSQKAIGEKYNVSQVCISKIHRGIKWALCP